MTYISLYYNNFSMQSEGIAAITGKNLNQPCLRCKLALVGDAAVGKTCLL